MTIAGVQETVTLHPRFNGPDESANGGYACGVGAGFVPGAAEATLRRPPPLGRPLTVRREDAGTVQLLDGAEVVVEARPSPDRIEPPPPVDLDTATRITPDPALLDAHVFPRCFVCGPARPDGLRIFPGELDDGLLATSWTPDVDLVDHRGLTSSRFVWAALDCPGGWATVGLAQPGTVSVLGRMHAVVHEDPPVAAPCVVVARADRREGRKTFATSALYDADGRLLASATTTWIAISQP